jgi:hypothetical protein
MTKATRRGLAFIVTVSVLSVLMGVAWASSASKTLNGTAYAGVHTEACEVRNQDDVNGGLKLHIKCPASGGAWVRYRFRDYAKKAPATISADLQDPQGCGRTRWVPRWRAIQVIVPPRCYLHVRSVTLVSQP